MRKLAHSAHYFEDFFAQKPEGQPPSWVVILQGNKITYQQTQELRPFTIVEVKQAHVSINSMKSPNLMV